MNLTDAPLFAPLSMQDASPTSRTLLEQAHRYFGFVPNLLATMAHSPSALRVYFNADLCFKHGTLTPGEQQIVLLAASKENDCRYCTASHGALAQFFANVPGDAILAIENGSPLSDPKLNALVNVTKQLVSRRGYVPRETINAFLEAGYSKDQLLEVLVGVGLKTISNYFDHVAAIEIDPEFLMRESN